MANKAGNYSVIEAWGDNEPVLVRLSDGGTLEGRLMGADSAGIEVDFTSFRDKQGKPVSGFSDDREPRCCFIPWQSVMYLYRV